MTSRTGSLRSQKIIRSLFAVVLLAATSFEPAFAASDERPSTWASAMDGIAGMSNLYRVSPGLYRSQQPAMAALQNILAGHPFAADSDPIRTVVSLRAFHDDDGDAIGKSDAVHYERLKFYAWHPEEADVIKFLRIVTTPAQQPVLVHCAHGSDRTGMMVAIYRIVVQGWSKQDALREMTAGGYGFHTIWHDLVAYIQHLDVDALKAKLAQVGPWEAQAGVIAQNAR
jgi:protein tyrosine/serine phosphatase